MKCPKCGSEKTILIQDKRGIPEAHCAECSAYIKKMSTGEVISYFSEKLSGNLDSKSEEREPDKESGKKTPDRGPCKFCTENYSSVAELTDTMWDYERLVILRRWRTAIPPFAG